MSEKNKKRNNVFFKKLWVIIVSIVGLIILLPSVLFVIDPFINLSSFIWTLFFELAFWPIFFANILILVLLLFLKGGQVFANPNINIVYLCSRFNKILFFQQKKRTMRRTDIMNYNVNLFYDFNIMK